LPVALLFLLAAPVSAPAFEIVPGSLRTELLDRFGQPTSLAGSHPDRLVSSFAIDNSSGSGDHARETTLTFPAGLSSNLSGFPACSRALFSEVFGNDSPCPPQTQVGLETLRESGVDKVLPLYNLEPGPNELAAFGTQQTIPAAVYGRLGADQSLSLVTKDLPLPPNPITAFKIELWGVPADHQEGGPYPRRPFLTTPTECGQALASTMTLRSYEHPQQPIVTSVDFARLSGCADLKFDPAVSIKLDNPVADAPTGGRVDLLVPQNEDPDGRASSQMRAATIALPAGLTVAPGAAVATAICSDAQFGLGSEADVACPARSRVGSVELTGPALPGVVSGAMYLGQGRPGERLRMLIAAAVSGSSLKFAAAMSPDPRTGQLLTNLTGLPPVAFDRMTLSFDGGPEALLATPIACGVAQGEVKMAPYSGGPAAERTLSVPIRSHDGSPCSGPPPFAPTISAGSNDVRAGRGGAFSTILRRADGEQVTERLSVAFPSGVSSNLGSVALCPSALAAAGACAAASRIGEADAEMGPGTSLARLQGGVYLTGPYRRAPFGVAIAFPANLGPFNLGSLVVRGSLAMDPLSGRVTLTTDPLPRVVEGVGVRFRTIALRIDRPGFMRNPTGCAPGGVVTTATSATGAVVRVETPFRVGGCVLLPFRPRLSLSLGDSSQLHKGGKPGLGISMRMPEGDANLRASSFRLPKVLGLSAGGLRAICARRAAQAGKCPRASEVGTGTARTPLLPRPMKGAIHVVQPDDSGPPDLWAALAGGGIEVNLRIETAEGKNGFETRMRGLPDIPLASFAMRLAAGKRGLLELSQGLCHGAKPRVLLAPADLLGQNGAAIQTRVRIAANPDCAGG
jgi:hypothetical protein